MASQTVSVGQWGGPGGQAWDDGFYTGVRKIELTYGDYIGSFSVVYDLNGKPFDGPKHPSNHSLKTAKIELQFPDEYLVSVSGYIAKVFGERSTPVIRSLTFKTNKNTFGPYGTQEGTPFNLPIQNGVIVGVYGRSGDVLDGIGFHLAV